MHRHVKNVFGVLFVLFIGLGGAAPAEAANRTACFTLRFKDIRSDCPESNDSGVTRACNVDPIFTTWSNPVGVLVDLFDHDSDGTPDEFIGTWRLNSPGQKCITFPWEGEAYENGETHPDVYVKAYPIFRSTDGGIAIRGRDSLGNTVPAVSWRDEYFLNCGTGSNCALGTLSYSTDANSAITRRVVALDTAQRVLEAFSGAIEGSGDIYLYLGRDEDDEEHCPNWSCASGSEVWLADDHLSRFDVPVHEVGHVLRNREMGLTSSGADDDRDGVDGHGWTTLEWDKLTASEGWANYVAAVAWWNPNVGASEPVIAGFDIEEPSPQGGNCHNASQMELQVARGFWDLDDTNQEEEAGVGDGDDYTSFATTALLNFWGAFPAGTANRQKQESDDNGVNVWDYAFNGNGGFTSTQETSFIHHNCLTDQDEN